MNLNRTGIAIQCEIREQKRPLDSAAEATTALNTIKYLFYARL